MSSVELYNAYQENEVAADQKYKGKKILLTGEVSSIDKDAFDNAIVIFGDGSVLGLRCEMKDENSAAKVKKGYQYSVIGECSGMILGSVGLDNCRLQ